MARNNFYRAFEDTLVVKLYTEFMKFNKSPYV